MDLDLTGKVYRDLGQSKTPKALSFEEPVQIHLPPGFCLEDGPTHPLSFEKADRELCFSRIRKELVMPDANLHFPKGDTSAYRKTWDSGVRCAVMQGGQGDVKHWAFNDPPRRKGKYRNAPPSPEKYRKLTTRVVELHPLTIAQNARTSGGGNISLVPTQAISVGPVPPSTAAGTSMPRCGGCAIDAPGPIFMVCPPPRLPLRRARA